MRENNEFNSKTLNIVTFNNDNTDILLDQFNSDIQNAEQEDKSFIKDMKKIEQKENNKTNLEEEYLNKEISNSTNNKSENHRKKEFQLPEQVKQNENLAKLDLSIHEGNSQQVNYHQEYSPVQNFLLLNQSQENQPQYQLNKPFYATNALYSKENFSLSQWNKQQENFPNQKLEFQNWLYPTQEQYQQKKPYLNLEQGQNLFIEHGYQPQKFPSLQNYITNPTLDMNKDKKMEKMSQNPFLSPIEGSQLPKNLYNQYDLLLQKIGPQTQQILQKNGFAPFGMISPLNKKLMDHDCLSQNFIKWPSKYENLETCYKKKRGKKKKIKKIRPQKRKKIKKKELFSETQRKKSKRKTGFKKFYSLKVNGNSLHPKKLFLKNANAKNSLVYKTQNKLVKKLILKKNEIAQNKVGNEKNKNLENFGLPLTIQNNNNNNIGENYNQIPLTQMGNNIPTNGENYFIFTNNNNVVGNNNQAAYNQNSNNNNNNNELEEQEFNLLNDFPPDNENNEEDIFQLGFPNLEQN